MTTQTVSLSDLALLERDIEASECNLSLLEQHLRWLGSLSKWAAARDETVPLPDLAGLALSFNLAADQVGTIVQVLQDVSCRLMHATGEASQHDE